MAVDAPSLGLDDGTDMRLRENDIHLFFVYPELITDTRLLDRYLSLLSDIEKQQLSRFYFERHRHQYLITRALIRTSLSDYYDVEPSDWVFGKNGFDKPHILSPKTAQPIQFNISHADGLIICGLTRKFDIGVDTEDCQRSTQAAFSRLSSYFSDLEIKSLEELPDNLRKERFFDYWTLKESYIKARGKGLSIPLRKFSFDFQADKLCGFHVDKDLDDNADNWQFWRLSMAERFRVAVAVNSADTAFTISAVNSVPLQSKTPIALDFL
jgi:4'-phosphopantetheinyl transferase